METSNASMTGMQEATHLLRYLQQLGLKFFQQPGGLDDDYRIMIPSQEIVVSQDLDTKTYLVTISIANR